MRILLILFLALSIGACHRKYTIQTKLPCDRQEAVLMANNRLEKHFKKLSDYELIVVEDSSYVYITYKLKTLQIGGGGDFKISKAECRIVDGKLYQ